MRRKKGLLTIPHFMSVIRAIGKKEHDIIGLHYELKITYAHIHKICKLFVSKGWVTSSREGVKNFISITESGKVICDAVNNLFKVMNITDDDLLKGVEKEEEKKVDKEVKEESKEEEKKVDEEVKEESKEEEKKVDEEIKEEGILPMSTSENIVE